MGAAGVLVDPSVFDDLPRLVEIGKQTFVKELVAQATVEALN